jgi:hypothetical protein
MKYRACEFVGDANTVAGRLVPCKNAGSVVMRLQGLEVIYMGKPCVCLEHMELLVSETVRATGRIWQIDHFLSDERWR